MNRTTVFLQIVAIFIFVLASANLHRAAQNYDEAAANYVKIILECTERKWQK